MNRAILLLVVASLLLVPTLGSANPNGVGDGTFDAQCGGACHGDADMNRSSLSTVSVAAPATAYEGLLTSASVTIDDIQTSATGVLGVFLLSDLSGAGDTPADDGWTILSNSQGGQENYLEITVEPGQTTRTVSWTLRAPSIGQYELHAAVHHGSEDESGAPFFGATPSPVLVEVKEVPENLPRLAESFAPPTQRVVGESTSVVVEAVDVDSMTVEWRLTGGLTMNAELTPGPEGTWSFTIPASLQPSVIEWRAHLIGEGPEQTTPWFQMSSEEPTWSVDERAAYLQSLALFLAFMTCFVLLQGRSQTDEKWTEASTLEHGGEW